MFDEVRRAVDSGAVRLDERSDSAAPLVKDAFPELRRKAVEDFISFHLKAL